jgi:hypothetical protein
MQGVKFYSIYLTKKSPVGREFNLKRKWPKLDVYGLNWILLKVYLNL